ncbi:ATP-binding protein [Spiroplasma culicicola]|uniref:AAA+ ATPase domain-containing protein n=1 Tax=Spiroplasma culicicola AES-1 TaxID=1276246 RepID=W6A867_9MOLU|nr:ATP-binding protein [Spiroplasma culicicola]AHI53338.1 hypothetical protein SCULI_v1c09980 [Spiroplasma culicicola AES-1]
MKIIEAQIKKIIDFSNTLSIKDFNNFYSLLCSMNFSEEELEIIQEEYATRNLGIKMDISKTDWVSLFYTNEINRLNRIIQNDDALLKLGGIKALFYGKTGTGKTSLVKKVVDENPNITFEDINFTSLVSSKMGQTQINIINLANKLNESENKKIVFLDEIDSIVSNRITSDLGEHSRIVATFIKFLDILQPNVIFFAATNLVEIIDDAIKRRFNVQLHIEEINFDDLFKVLEHEKIFITKKRQEWLKRHLLNNNFNFGEIKNFKDHLLIEKLNGNEEEEWFIFVEYFLDRFQFDLDNESVRNERKLKKILEGFK